MTKPTTKKNMKHTLIKVCLGLGALAPCLASAALPTSFATNVETLETDSLAAIDAVLPVIISIAIAGLIFWAVQFVIRKLRATK